MEDVLGYVSFAVSEIDKEDPREFKKRLDDALRGFKGNALSTPKTIANWRTEISSLFGFFIEESDITYATDIARSLSSDLDFVRFFRQFVSFFQYPGGHLKSHEILKIVDAGISFHPCRWLAQFILYQEEIKDTPAKISDLEFCHCVLNDLRVTKGLESIQDTYKRINRNRRSSVEYDSTGDVVRYAKDIMDYMEWARLFSKDNDRYYYPRKDGRTFLEKLAQSKHFFKLYERCSANEEVSNLRPKWFEYTTMIGMKFVGEDVTVPIGDEIISQQLTFLGKKGKGLPAHTKKIGDAGEALALVHEKLRIKKEGRSDLQHLINLIPNVLAVGYDIQSVEVDESKRYVEVKSSISRSSLTFQRFHLTTNEWVAAETLGERYYIYRLQITDQAGKQLFLIRDPVGKYKQSLLKMVPRDGADIIFNDNCGTFEDLLEWKN